MSGRTGIPAKPIGLHPSDSLHPNEFLYAVMHDEFSRGTYGSGEYGMWPVPLFVAGVYGVAPQGFATTGGRR